MTSKNEALSSNPSTKKNFQARHGITGLIIPALRRLKQEDHEFKAAWAI
jgi:hypothetical protein